MGEERVGLSSAPIPQACGATSWGPERDRHGTCGSAWNVLDPGAQTRSSRSHVWRSHKEGTPGPPGGLRGRGYLGDQLRPRHAQEVTEAVPLGSHDRELGVPGRRRRGAVSVMGTVHRVNLPRSSWGVQKPQRPRGGRNQEKGCLTCTCTRPCSFMLSQGTPEDKLPQTASPTRGPRPPKSPTQGPEPGNTKTAGRWGPGHRWVLFHFESCLLTTFIKNKNLATP